MQNRMYLAEKQATVLSWTSLFLTSVLIIGCGTDDATFVLRDGDPVVGTAHAGTPPLERPTIEFAEPTEDVSALPVDESAPVPDEEGDDPSVDVWTGVVPAENAHAAYLEAEAHYYRGERNEAIPLLRSSIAARAEFAPAHYLLGLCSRATDELTEAEAAFRETIRLSDGHLRAHVNLGRVLLDADRPADARDALHEALDRGLESDGLYNVLGLAELDLDNGDKADEAFELAISLNPENLYALNNLGLLRIRQGRYEEAVEPLTRASQMDDAPAYVFNNLGLALEQTGQLAESVDALATARDAGHGAAAESFTRVRTSFDEQLAKLEKDAVTENSVQLVQSSSAEETPIAPE